MKATKVTKHGVIYILTNPSFPDYVKIGYASDIERRLRELNRSETIPYAFRVYAVYEVDGTLTDKELHKLIDTLNPDLRTIENFDGKERVKEFYAMSAKEAFSLLESIAKISGTQECLKRMKPEGHEIADEKMANDVSENAKRGKFKFSMIGLKPGDKVKSLEKPSIEVEVVDDKHVEYKGQTLSLTALAKMLTGIKHATSGPTHFTYDGKKLSDLRREME